VFRRLDFTARVGGELAPSPFVHPAVPARTPVPDQSGSIPASTLVVNAMTVDVEDYFQVSAFEAHVTRDHWDRFESRVCRNTERILEIFADSQVTATFFVLGWVGQRFPDLVRRIAAAGHEIGSHGYSHRLVYSMTPKAFGEDVRRAKGVLEAAASVPVVGYRAPSFSITAATPWAFDELLAAGYAYDASVFPIRHDRYGIPDAPRHPYAIRRDLGSLWELPSSTVRVCGVNLPIGGGGYFRLLPYEWTRRGIAHVNAVERRPVMFYLHPWEIDPDQPRVPASVLSRFRHYRNLSKTEGRLRRLLEDFQFGPALSMLDGAAIGSLESASPAGLVA
jgi:polysaccharide deacetylase family protein (PEP-CTERM system associated)